MDRVIAAAEASHDEVIFHCWSDHGMASIQQEYDVFPLLEKIPWGHA